MKACTKCYENKPLIEFSLCKANKSGHKNICKDCGKSYSKEYRKKNKPSVITANKIYRLLNRERTNAYSRKWRRNNKAKVAALVCRKNALKQLRTPKWLNKQQIDEMTQFYIDAAYIQNLTKTKMQVDHIIPLHNPIVSGLHVPWNLQILTAKENRAKSNNL